MDLSQINTPTEKFSKRSALRHKEKSRSVWSKCWRRK